MPSYDNERFQPLPPIRTATSGSQKSQSSGTASPDMLSPTSTYSQGMRSPASPTEASFFGAIGAKIRNRSRSRSRAGTSRKRSKSPMVLPPEHLPPSTTSHPASPTYATQRPQQPRHVSSGSQGSISSPTTKRPTMPTASRRSTSSSSDMWRGRHSNSWLFNDFSFTETASKAFGRKP